MSELRDDARLLHASDHKSAPVEYDTQYPHILGTFGVWVAEIGDCDLATVRLPDGSITVMPTQEAKAMG